MDNVHSLPFNAQTADQMLMQIGRDMGEDLEACVVVFRQRSTGLHFIAAAAPDKEQIGFLATCTLMVQNFAINLMQGFKMTDGPKSGDTK